MRGKMGKRAHSGFTPHEHENQALAHWGKALSQIDDSVPHVRVTLADDLRLQALYRAFYRSVHARCRRILRDDAAAEDATQETFLRVQLHLCRTSDVEDVRFWIHRIAVNYCLNQVRNRVARERSLASGRESTESDLENTLMARDEARRLLRKLPERLRSVAWLRHVEGLDQSAVAELLGISRRTVVSRVAELRRIAAGRGSTRGAD